MENSDRLILLKKDLQLTTVSQDDYLMTLLELSGKLIEREGIRLIPDDIESEMVRIHYAAYLFRKRAGTDTSMPRFLRYELNNLLFSQKAGGSI